MYQDIWDDEPGDEPLSAWDAVLLHAKATGDVAVVGARSWGCSPEYAYTFGLTAYGHPELLVSGIESFEVHDRLGPLLEEIRNGRLLRPGEELQRDSGQRHLIVVPVADPTVLISVQEHFAGPGREPVAALQIVWADQEGNWPWEVGWLGEPQELFGVPADVAV